MNTADVVVVLGDGNFSYTAAALRSEEYMQHTHFVAGTLNPQCEGNRNVEAIRMLGGTVIEESVDLKHCEDKNYLRGLLPQVFWPLLLKGTVHLVFNFPHTGVSNEHPANVTSNQELLRQLFTAGKTWFGRNTTIAVTLKTGGNGPYDSWDLRGVAEQAGWARTEAFSFPFDTLTSHGYKHETTLKFVSSVSLWSALTYLFVERTRWTAADVVVVLGNGNFRHTEAAMRSVECMRHTHFVLIESVDLKHCDKAYYLWYRVPLAVRPLLKERKTHVIFNFPHTGVRNVYPASVTANQELLRQVFTAGKTWFGSETTIAVTLGSGMLYDCYTLLGVAEQAGWECTKSFPFPLAALRDHGYNPMIGNERRVAVCSHSATNYVFKHV